jgi:hypothetical protein
MSMLLLLLVSVGVVAVHALNHEFKLILREVKNGMFHVASYVFVKTILVLPMMFLFAVFSIGIQGYLVQQFHPGSFPTLWIIFAAGLYVWESMAEFYSVCFENPVIGMVQYVVSCLAALLFGGIFLPLHEMFWPSTMFYYLLPIRYYLRSSMYAILIDEDFEPCTDRTTSSVVDELSIAVPLLSSEDTVGMDILILLGIAALFKVAYILAVVLKADRSS